MSSPVLKYSNYSTGGAYFRNTVYHPHYKDYNGQLHSFGVEIKCPNKVSGYE